MRVELTDTEVKRLISTDLFELSFIKGILQKLGNEVKDWTPDYADL